MSKVVLLKKLFNIQKGLNEPLDRDGEGLGYKYLSSDKVIDAVKPLLDKEGVMCNTKVVSYDVKEYNQMLSNRHIFENVFILNLQFIFTDVESGIEIAIDYAGASSIGIAKGMSSAMTSAKKAFYIDYFNIRVKDVEDIEQKELQSLDDRINGCKDAKELQSLFNTLSKDERLATEAIRAKKVDELKKEAQKRDEDIKEATRLKIAEVKEKKAAAKVTPKKTTAVAKKTTAARKTTTTKKTETK